ncbi:MAG: hypothetical protein ACFFFB_15510 [Candidatus Heimdallarchaeota archaeon]
MNKKSLLIFILVSTALFISFNINLRSTKAQGHDLILNLNTSFKMSQYSDLQGSNSTVNSINIELPTTEWNITNIELDFMNLTFEKETIIVEDQPTGFERVYFTNGIFNNLGLATQIRLDHPETIYGVFIYGNKSAGTTQNIQVQIRGYNDTNNTPNSTIFTSQTLNISTTLGWYIQNFSSPLNLPSGNYFLVLNGTNFSLNGQYYYWHYNSNPSDPSLYSATTLEDSVIWADGVDNKTFLYKIIRKSKAPLFPESINMSVNINNQEYQVLNGGEEGSGVLSQTFQDFRPLTTTLSFAVNNNASKALDFNISYHLYFEESLITLGEVSIQESQSNEWILSRTFIRYTDNYSIKFKIPLTWENISVFRDGQNMEFNITINENYIFIPNNTLIENANWEIMAESPSFSIGLNAPKTDYYLGQEVQFSLATPTLEGTYTYILINSADIEEFNISKTIPPDTILFSYTLPLSSPDGTYIAYVFWNNQTDAGVIVQEFIISIPKSPPPDMGIFFIIITVVTIAPIAAILSFIAYKRVSKNRRYEMQRLLEKCVDILNLNYLIVTDIRSGIDIYSQSFGEQKGDSTLISGFLQAVRAFGSEVAKDKDKTVKIQYKNSILLMTEFVNVRIILNMKAEPSVDFHYAVESLAYDVYKNYGKMIDEFHGNVKDFKGIKELVEEHLNVSFIYPLKIEMPDNVRLNSAEREMVEKAKKLMEDYGLDHIYALYLLPENECSPKDAQTVLNLIKKGVFVPQR